VTAVTYGGLVALLATNPNLEAAARLGPDEEFALDSLALTWLVHLLEEEYGVLVDPADPRLCDATTLRTVLACIGDAGARVVTRGGGGEFGGG
jgi:acyl carrier protein